MPQHPSAAVAAAAALAVLAQVASGCASSTMILSDPPGAKVYINDQYWGRTPVTYADTRIVGSVNYLRLELEGHEAITTTFSRNERLDAGALIGGLLVLVPFLWIMGYDPMRVYELAPGPGVLYEERYEEEDVRPLAPVRPPGS